MDFEPLENQKATRGFESLVSQTQTAIANLEKLYALPALSQSSNLALSIVANDWERQSNILKKRLQDLPTVIVGIAGQTGAGKSTLISSLLGNWVCGTSVAGACTCLPTEFAYSEQYSVSVAFISIKMLQNELARSQEHLVDTLKDPDPRRPPLSELSPMLYAIREQDGEDSLSRIPLKDLVERANNLCSRSFGRTLQITAQGPAEILEQVRLYSDARGTKKPSGLGGGQGRMTLWPFVRSLKVWLPANILKFGTILVDLPGSEDVLATRSNLSDDYIEKSSAILIASATARASSDGVASGILKAAVLHRLKLNGALNNLIMVSTKSDDISYGDCEKYLSENEEIVAAEGLTDASSHISYQIKSLKKGQRKPRESAVKDDIQLQLNQFRSKQKGLCVRIRNCDVKQKITRGLTTLFRAMEVPTEVKPMVFNVSAQAHQAFADSDFETIEHTEIPALQRHLGVLALGDRLELVRDILESIRGLQTQIIDCFTTIGLDSCSANFTENLHKEVNLAFEGAKGNLSGLATPVDKLLGRKRAAEESFSMVRRDAGQKTVKVVQTTLEAITFYKTLRAIMRRHGEFDGSSNYYDINMTASEPVNSFIVHPLSNIFDAPKLFSTNLLLNGPAIITNIHKSLLESSPPGLHPALALLHNRLLHNLKIDSRGTVSNVRRIIKDRRTRFSSDVADRIKRFLLDTYEQAAAVTGKGSVSEIRSLVVEKLDKDQQVLMDTLCDELNCKLTGLFEAVEASIHKTISRYITQSLNLINCLIQPPDTKLSSGKRTEFLAMVESERNSLNKVISSAAAMDTEADAASTVQTMETYPLTRVTTSAAVGLPTLAAGTKGIESWTCIKANKTAGEIANKSLSAVLEKCTEGANLLSICQDGDKLVEEGCAAVYNKDKKKPTPKGVAFPCTVSVNNVVCHFSPLPSDPSASQTLKKDDVVKVLLGAHIDGYPAAVGETIIVGASSATPVTGTKADLLAACFNATEAALRFVKPGSKNWDVTDGVKKVLAEYGGSIKGMEGMVSHQHEQNGISGKKTINLFPSADQHRDKDSTFIFEEGEVYGLDVCLTTGEDAKPKSLGDRTTIFQKTASTYQLKMKTSRSTYSEIANKAGSFPFTLRTLEEEQKARMGVKECVQHGLLKEFDMSTTADPKDFTAQTFVTFSVTKTGASRITPPPNFYTGPTSDKVKSEVKITDEEMAALLARSLKVGKKKSKSTSKVE